MGKRHWKPAVVWAFSLVVVAVGSSWAQNTQRPPAPKVLAEPDFVSGNDIGFRIEGKVNGLPFGKLVVRINGAWVDTVAWLDPAPAAR